ncbi:MAG: sugar phosphate nucleotidyltransferase [Candidatus Kapaibacteriota bacterium]
MNNAVIMAGGFGTRLRPLTMSIPKPMVPLANRPMMGHIVNLLKQHGITKMVSVLYFQPEEITSYFGDGSAHGVQMDYVTAEADYGTAGSVKNAQHKLGEPFIIISGDVLTDFDITAAIDFHRKKGAMATIVLTRVPQPLQYGIVMTTDDGRISRFLEKPSWGEVFSDTINTGIYILEPEVLDLIPEKTEFDFSQNLFPTMLEKGLPLYGYIADGYWKDIGNLQEYQQAHYDVLAGKVHVSIPGTRCDSSVCGEGLSLDPSAHLEGLVVIGQNVTIGPNVRLNNCVLGDNVVVETGTSMTGTVLWSGVHVGAFTDIANTVVCSRTTIGNHVAILDNVIIAEDCVIEDNARLLSNIKLWPRKVVEAEAVLARSLVMEERWAKELFTDARISGKSNVDMNPEFAAKLGAALGTMLGAGTLVVASRDEDAVSRMVKRSMTAGLMSAGVSAVDLQSTSIPQTRQEMKSGRFVAGFHVRKSPKNEGQTDIILFGKDGRDLSLASAKKIERFFYGEDIRRVPHQQLGRLSFSEHSISNYVERVLAHLDVDVIRAKRYALLVDYSHGLAAPVFPQILGELDCRVLAMNSYVDAAHFADPMQEVLQQSATIMQSLGYQIGFKIDPGAEKIGMVDERGIWFTGLRLLTIVTKLFLETHRHLEPYTIAVPVQATQEIDLIAAEHNVRILRIRSSHAAMMEATRDTSVLFAGGTRGNFIFPEFLSASDGMYSACYIMYLLAVSGRTLRDLDQELPRRYQATTAVPCKWETKGTVMRHAMAYSEGMERVLIDGVQLLEGTSSVLLLPDREHALFSVTAEANSAAEAEELRDRYAALVVQWQNSKAASWT